MAYIILMRNKVVQETNGLNSNFNIKLATVIIIHEIIQSIIYGNWLTMCHRKPPRNQGLIKAECLNSNKITNNFEI